MIALTDPVLSFAVDTWTCVDFYDNLVSGVDIDRGRQSEFDVTDTSTAVVYLNDTDGKFDQTNGAALFFGCLGKQIMLQAWNAFDGVWVKQARMWIDRITYEFNPATRDGVSILSNVQLHCVDLFDYLGRMEMDTSSDGGGRVFGNTPPAASEQIVFYEDTSSGGAGMQTRLTQVADDCNLSSDWYTFFTGNVELLEGLYDVGDSPLTVMRDAVDAEFPGIANLFTDKTGRLHGHGRRAFFEPDAVALDATPGAWNFARWHAGDGAAILIAPTLAQIRPPLAWLLDRERIYNVGYAWPSDIEEADKPGQLTIDAGSSIDDYNRRLWSAEKLLTKEGSTTGLTGDQETKKYGEFWVTNTAAPAVRLEAISFKSIGIGEATAESTWSLMLGADIADIIELTHSYPGANVSIDDQEFYIQGSSMSIRPLNPDMDMVEVTFNVTPKSIYSDDVGLLG